MPYIRGDGRIVRGAAAESAARARVRVRNLFSSAWFWLACGIALGLAYTRGGHDSSTPPPQGENVDTPSPAPTTVPPVLEDEEDEGAATCDSPAGDSDDAAAKRRQRIENLCIALFVGLDVVALAYCLLKRHRLKARIAAIEAQIAANEAAQAVLAREGPLAAPVPIGVADALSPVGADAYGAAIYWYPGSEHHYLRTIPVAHVAPSPITGLPPPEPLGPPPPRAE